MNGLFCPNCKIDKHDSAAEKDGLYKCAECNKTLGYYCRGCNKVYIENRLGRRGDEWHCKECNAIQWGYTEYKRLQLGLEK